MADSSTAIAVGVSVAVVVTLILGGLFAIYLRRRNRHVEVKEPQDAGRHSLVLDRLHPASRVTPFKPGQEAPRFTHTPGEAMRVARRRSDGGWDFNGPLLTIKPPEFSPLDPHSPCPSPTTSVSTMGFSRKDKKLPGELTSRGYVEVDIEGIPPPAYSPSQTTLHDTPSPTPTTPSAPST